MTLSRRHFLLSTAALAGAGGYMAGARAESLANLPSTMIWSTYDVGSTGYIEASAIADALGKKYGARVRLQPSGTSIGRLLPLKEGRVSHAWLANEAFFAAEGLFEYGAADWGPQDIRVLLGRQAGFSVACTKESGITKPAELKGKRFAYVAANTSVNIKMEAILAFAGLTWKDMQLVNFPSYAASLKALVEGKADAAGATPTAAILRELEASPRGISWVELDPNNKAGWEAGQKAVPFVEPYGETVGAGLSADKPVSMMGYRYPMICVYANTPEAEVYAIMKATVETFDLYKDANSIMPRWAVKQAGTPPADAAFHDGAVRYLKEIGQWTAEHQAWQDRTLKRQKALQAAWQETTAAAKAQNVAGDDFPKFWETRRVEALAKL